MERRHRMLAARRHMDRNDDFDISQARAMRMMMEEIREDHDDLDEESLRMMEEEVWIMRMEEDRMRRERREEERQAQAWRPPPPLRRGISSFSQEHSVLGSRFHKPTKAPPAVPGLEQVAASPEFDAKRLFLKRLTACVGWAVHGIVFEFVDNTRVGCILDGFPKTRLDLTDENIQRRHGVEWQNVDYGDYIVGIHGNRLHKESLLWFCQTVVLEFRSGKTIRFEAGHEPWRGEPFAYQVPQPCLVYRITFRHEQTQDMRGLITSIHLPISVANMAHLPLQNKQTLEEILAILSEVDAARESRGRKALTDDLWWNILGWIRAWEMPVSPVADNDQEDDGLCSQLQGLSTA